MEQELEDVRLHLQGVASGPFCQPPYRMFPQDVDQLFQEPQWMEM